MITISWNGTNIELSPDLYWADEFDWSPVEQSSERTVTGALILSKALKVGGRPITLRPEDDRSAWTTRAVLDQLSTWAAAPEREMVLTMRGQARAVVFNQEGSGAIDAEPVLHFSDVVGTDYYRVTLRFMEI